MGTGTKKVRFIGNNEPVHGTYGKMYPGRVFEASISDWKHLIDLPMYENAEPKETVRCMVSVPARRIYKDRGDE